MRRRLTAFAVCAAVIIAAACGGDAVALPPPPPPMHPAPGASGAGVNTLRICGDIAYLAGYNPTLYGVLIVDVSDPAKMQVLSFIPANAGTRSAYLRADCGRKVLAIGHSSYPDNPNKPVGGPAKTGLTLYDVTDPRQPKLLSEFNNKGGQTHGMEMDDKYVYLCGTMDNSKRRNEEIIIIDYSPKLTSRSERHQRLIPIPDGQASDALNRVERNFRFGSISN